MKHVSAQNADTKQQHNSEQKRTRFTKEFYQLSKSEYHGYADTNTSFFLKQYNQIFLRSVNSQDPFTFHLKIRRLQ